MNAVLMVIVVMSLSQAPDTGKILVRHKHRVMMSPSIEACQKIRDELADPANGPAALVLCIQPSDVTKEPVIAPAPAKNLKDV